MTRFYVIAAFLVLALVALVGVGGYYAGRASVPPPPPGEALACAAPMLKTVYVDRVVTRTKHVVETRPDGSTTTTDETENEDEHRREDPPKPDALKPVMAALAPKANWHASVGAGLTFTSNWVYNVSVERRLFGGPIFAGVEATSQGAVYLKLGAEF